MFHDLNISNDSKLKAGETQLDSLRKRLELCSELGYEVVALNNTVVGKIGQNNVNPFRKMDIPDVSGKGFRKNFRVLSRLSVVVEDISQNYELNANNPVVSSYDIVAVQPTTEKLFQAACGTFEVDIISLELSTRLPFYLKHSTVGLAIERGIHFEISYSACIKDSTARRHLISNAINLIRVTRGKNIIVTSEAQRAMELRGPYDIINLCSLFGLNQAAARDCLTINCRSVIYHSETRRNVHKGVVSVNSVGDLDAHEEWKTGEATAMEL
ncbi:ribonuclease P protein subunit p30 [Basidiobolus meristosporus CBS 931.73]|uniref:Ribonuclease P protein subunit p30 n=1 Tax=Basidiobolus meristosporus CBS 931.73 TaxID=1314790 RepID=A0A1Y1YTP8_9FUNG|nr:ribonuclease P protein subunit p30 [Basidiobolus meristosporus CBS 931.73]|eukprot:ORY01412.1 ribonuclease P protein subunit p30 [Basidiobolus meristosporus CBS 931.73]